jgi:hypothetical protein
MGGPSLVAVPALEVLGYSRAVPRGTKIMQAVAYSYEALRVELDY